VGDSIEIELRTEAPFNVVSFLAYLRAKAIPGIEIVGAQHYQRSIGGDETTVLSVDLSDAGSTGMVKASCPSTKLTEGALRALVGRLVDIDAPAVEIAAHLGRDPILAPLVKGRPGVRIPGTIDPFELSVRAVLGQQISVAAAKTLAARVASRWGSKLETEAAAIHLTFPTARQLVDAPLEQVGVSPRRTAAIQALARTVLTGGLDLQMSGTDAQETLLGISGIGPWTTAYIDLRGLGNRDAIPVGDLGLRQALADTDKPLRAAEVAERAENWRPWRGYGAVHLWSTYLTMPGIP
jgi:AraC family transcriptional regulator of adaptative response / DNA-3-methyladenine glycosylase II